MKSLIYALYMLVGTYTGGESEGIYVYGFDPVTARTEYVGMARVDNPSYMALSPDGLTVYAVSENGGAQPSYANSLHFDPATGSLSLTGSRETGGAPCNIAVNGALVVTANYGGGDISVFGIDEEGGLSALEQTLRLPAGDRAGDSRSHMHCVKFSPDGRYLFAADLGTDKILRYDVRAGRSGDPIDGSSLKTFDVPAGSGPRHFIFDGAGRNLYLINEVSGTVTAFRYNDGELRPFQTVQADTAGGHGSADIALSLDGRYLYASNRLKNDGVAIFAVSPEDGRNADGNTTGGILTPIGYRNTGLHPRNLAMAPGGKFLTVANRDTGSVEIYAIDPNTGALTPAEAVSLDRPVCVLFVPNPGGGALR